jgi:2-polyprenyl-3-methyl-5-hydroxy-6-metoxy-1,4-benzoquinol methylase
MPKPQKKRSIDIGRYNADPAEYGKLVEDLYANYPPITLPPEYAQFVEENQLRLLIRLARYKFVAKMLKKTDRVMEVGSGSGLGAVFLGQHCAEVTGIEIKTSEIEEARALNRRKNVRFETVDLFKVPASHRYDCVVALDVIEHMPIAMGRKLVRAMAGQLKDTGLLFIGTPSIYSYPYQSPLSRASHVKCYDLPELVEVIEGSFKRTLSFSMNDELVHTGYHKMAWYYFVLGLMPKR